MNDKRLTIWIDGREALPVRAIPYVTKWIRFTPDRVALHFARDERALGVARGRVFVDAYHLSGNVPIQVMPSEWEAEVANIEGFEAETWKHGRDELGEKIGYAAWRNGSVAKLPEGVFVWLDEFDNLFRADVKCTGCYKDNPGDDKLTLAPKLNATTRAMVMEGFDMPKAQAAHTAKQAVPDVVKNTANNPIPTNNWKLKIQAEATRRWKELVAFGCSPTRNSIKGDLAKWCRDNKVKTDGDIFPNEDYIYRHVIRAAIWQSPTD